MAKPTLRNHNTARKKIIITTTISRRRIITLLVPGRSSTEASVPTQPSRPTPPPQNPGPQTHSPPACSTVHSTTAASDPSYPPACRSSTPVKTDTARIFPKMFGSAEEYCHILTYVEIGLSHIVGLHNRLLSAFSRVRSADLCLLCAFPGASGQAVLVSQVSRRFPPCLSPSLSPSLATTEVCHGSSLLYVCNSLLISGCIPML